MEADMLACSGSVREKYLRHNPTSVMEMSDKCELEELWEQYFPASQPRKRFEEAYHFLMREVIDDRLKELDECK